MPGTPDGHMTSVSDDNSSLSSEKNFKIKAHSKTQVLAAKLLSGCMADCIAHCYSYFQGH